MSRVLIIDGHPDAAPERFARALVRAYQEGAQSAGHEVRTLSVAEIDLPCLRSPQDYQTGEPSASVREAQHAISWCEHVVIVYPLWLGSMPALLKAFFEQVFRPGFAFPKNANEGLFRKLLKGRSARVVVTMGMPALFYRLFYRAHSLKSLERNILAFVGFKPIRASIIGTIETKNAKVRENWLERMRTYGRRAR